MPLGSRKLTSYKNKFNAGTGSPDLVVLNIADSVSNPNSGIIDYQTVQFDITSNRPDTTFYYNFTGNISGSDFTNSSVSGSITTDSNGNASISKTLANVALTEDIDFSLELKRSETGPQVAESNTITLYNIEFANVSATGTSTVVNTGNILLDGTYVEYTANGTFTVNDFGDTQSNVFLNVIGFYDTNSYYYQNTIKLLAVGGGSGGSNYHSGGGYSIPDGIPGSGGGGGNVKLVNLSLSNLDVANTNVTVGAGSLAGIDDPALPGPTYYSKLGDDTVVFESSNIEVTAIGGTYNDSSESTFSASKAQGGASNQYGTSAHKQGGLADTFLYNSVQYHLGGGGAGATQVGEDSNSSDSGGDGGDGRGIQKQNAPYYDGTSPTSVTYYGGGGGGWAAAYTYPAGNPSIVPVTKGVGGNGGGGNAGFDATANTGGGGGAGADGGSGYVAIRYPSGTNFRFLSNTNLA